MKKPRLKRDWIGVTVETLRELSNGYAKIPAGTRCTVRDNYGGLRLETPKCGRCGIRLYMTRVAESDVVIVDDQREVKP
ncbi:MAG: hypothetical protein OEV33_01185 [Armatimonadota bacterium]|nr:hypothetical protein [Armatimonadota bacterium]